MSARADLDALLDRSADDVKAAARTAFGDLVAGRPIVLHGAGGMGRNVLRELRAAGAEPLCFSDAGAIGGAGRVDGLEVLPVAEACGRHGRDAVFVVTVFNPHSSHASVKSMLEGLGAGSVCSWVLAGWAYADALLPKYPVDLPHKVLEHRDEILRAFELLDDVRSQEEFVGQIGWRLTGDFSFIPEGDPTTDQYFSPDVLSIRSDEVFVDCGAFNGDTVASLAAHADDGVRQIFSLEPDPANLEALSTQIAALPQEFGERTHILPWAVGASRGTARWSNAGQASAGIDPEGEIAVEIAPIDDLLELGAIPTYIKMDIEGAEPDALRGAAGCLEHRPTLAVCVYHQQDHIWTLPLMIDELVTDYRFLLRRYEADGFDVVLYALPRER